MANCFSLEDNEEAFACLEQEVSRIAAIPGACGPRIILLTQENCDPCKKERARLLPKINSGGIVEVGIDTPEGQELVFKNQLEFVPAIIVVDCDNRMFDLG